MYKISYQYKGESHIANVLPDKSNSSLKYKVILPDGVEFIIVAEGTRNAEGNIIWSQSHKSGEIIQPPDFLQAVGGGVENHFKGPDYKKIFKRSLFVLILVVGTLWLVSNNILLPISGKCHEAVIINKTVMHGTRTHTYTLSYEFWINGVRYTGDSGESEYSKYSIGRSICIVYLNYYPRTNKPVSYFFQGEIKCSCGN
jgi:hypothetical protein